jgi:hypothetical protein
VKSLDMELAKIVNADYLPVPEDVPAASDIQNTAQLMAAISKLEEQMRAAAKNFEFEKAAALRDRIRAMKQRDMFAIFGTSEPINVEAGGVNLPTESSAEAEVKVAPGRSPSVGSEAEAEEPAAADDLRAVRDGVRIEMPERKAKPAPVELPPGTPGTLPKRRQMGKRAGKK